VLNVDIYEYGRYFNEQEYAENARMEFTFARKKYKVINII
jgi:hypothetical protein